MTLELYIPGLLAVPARYVGQLELPPVPALEEWLRCSASREIPRGRYGPVAHWLGVSTPPLAALAGLAANVDGAVLLADPVHFKAGMHDLVVFAGPALGIDEVERKSLGESLAEFFETSPRVVTQEEQLFVASPGPLDIVTTPLYEAQGRTVRELLPQGRDAHRLHAWMNEMQMFLHDHPVNGARTARGLPAVNGIWLHGEGTLPVAKDRRDTTVFATSLPMRGLGKYLGKVRDVASLEAMASGPGRKIVEMRDCVNALDADDVDSWRQAVIRIDADVLAPLLQSPGNNELVLLAGDGLQRSIASGRKPWWRRFLQTPRQGRRSLRLVEE